MKDLTNGGLQKCLEFARTINDVSLQDSIDRLNKADENMRTETTVMNDFAPRSFYFERWREHQLISNGGVIYHGQHDRGGDGGAPTFSVNLAPTNGWSIHT